MEARETQGERLGDDLVVRVEEGDGAIAGDRVVG